MNIQMQVCGVFIILLLMFFYKRKETIGLTAGKIFEGALYVMLTCLILDIVSVVHMYIAADVGIPEWFVKLECKLYLVALMWVTFFAFFYTCTDVYQKSYDKKIITTNMVWTIIVSIIIMIVPIYIYSDGVDVYTYGPACYMTYFGAFISISATVVMIIKQNKVMNPKRKYSMIAWLALWLMAAVIQFINREWLLVSFAGALGMMILFFELENPEAYLDKSTGFFNSYCFIQYVKQNYAKKIWCCGFFISLEDAHGLDIPAQKVDGAMCEIVNYIRTIPKAKIFKTDEKEFALIFNESDAYENAFGQIKDRFKQGFKDANSDTVLYLNPYYVVVPDAAVAKKADDMFEMLKYSRAHCKDDTEKRTIMVDVEAVEVKHQKEKMLEVLLEAMDDDRVEVFYQPIYSTKKKKFVSAEALVRIRNKDGSIIPPGLFIPVAEETGLISALGKIVFKKTCEFIKEEDIEKYGIEYIEVNLSVVQCENKELAEMYKKIMDECGLKPELINLEITETASIVRKNNILDNMNDLIEYGVSFSLDDFGNGQSNLNYIVDMPVDIVKFDRDMTQAYLENEKAQFVVQAAMNMVHDMQLKVVAEGIETAEQLKAFEDIGIDYIQGYYFAKPMDRKAFIEFLVEKGQKK